MLDSLALGLAKSWCATYSVLSGHFIFVFYEIKFVGIEIALCDLVHKVRVYMGCVMRKPVFRDSDQVRHKPGCTTTEDDKRLEISI